MGRGAGDSFWPSGGFRDRRAQAPSVAGSEGLKLESVPFTLFMGRTKNYGFGFWSVSLFLPLSKEKWL